MYVPDERGAPRRAPAARDPLAEFSVALVAGREPSRGITSDALHVLGSYIRTRFPTISHDDARDIAGDAVASLLRRMRDAEIDPERVAGYLLTAVRNGGVDHLKRARHQRELSTAPEYLPDTPASEADVVARLDRGATVKRVRHALLAARSDGDATAYRVAACLLDQIEMTGEQPSSRRLAELCGLSHTGVAKALQRFRAYLDESADE